MIDHDKYADELSRGLLPTQMIKINPENPLAEDLSPAAIALQQGELVVFPTETVYGLGANALDANSVKHIFAAKGRPADNPLIIHVVDMADLTKLTSDIPDVAYRLFRHFSPGPLTLILKKKSVVPEIVTAGLDTVAVRVPAHPVARKLIRLAGVPVAAPSANRSGRPSPTRAWHVKQDLWGRVSYILDGGSCVYGLESTVLDLSGREPVILRPGSITAAQIKSVTGTVCIAAEGVDLNLSVNENSPPRSPGIKYRHYAPRARLLIADAADIKGKTIQIELLLQQLQKKNISVGIISSDEILRPLIDKFSIELLSGADNSIEDKRIYAVIYAEKTDAQAAGAVLFDALRRLDQIGVAVIIAEGIPEDEKSAAYMNRLVKAAEKDHSGGRKIE